jgi:phosphatidate phosphatase APP1
MSWTTLAGFVDLLSQGVQDFKVDRMKKVHGWLPQRKFLCVGDSTQKDPESYGEIYRTFPGFVGQIFIRIVEGVNPDKEKDLNSPERFAKAFEGVPANVWKTFRDPKEVTDAVTALKG